MHEGELHGLLQFQGGDAELLHKDIVHCIASERALAPAFFVFFAKWQ